MLGTQHRIAFLAALAGLGAAVGGAISAARSAVTGIGVPKPDKRASTRMFAQNGRAHTGVAAAKRAARKRRNVLKARSRK